MLTGHMVVMWQQCDNHMTYLPQVMMCKSGEELLLVTLNHLDGIRKLIGSSDKHISLVDQTCIKLTEVCCYGNHQLVNYFAQDCGDGGVYSSIC